MYWLVTARRSVRPICAYDSMAMEQLLYKQHPPPMWHPPLAVVRAQVQCSQRQSFNSPAKCCRSAHNHLLHHHSTIALHQLPTHNYHSLISHLTERYYPARLCQCFAHFLLLSTHIPFSLSISSFSFTQEFVELL